MYVKKMVFMSRSFPRCLVMPGVLIVEAFKSSRSGTAGIDPKEYANNVYLMGVDKVDLEIQLFLTVSFI